MNQQGTAQAQEPSMEEVLDSIRRIIAEDVGEESLQKPSLGKPTLDVLEGGSNKMTDSTQPKEAPALSPPEEEEDVLDLTQVVDQDGNIVEGEQRETEMSADAKEQEKAEAPEEKAEDAKEEKAEAEESKTKEADDKKEAKDGPTKVANDDTEKSEDGDVAQETDEMIKGLAMDDEGEPIVSEGVLEESAQAMSALAKFESKVSDEIASGTFGKMTIEEMMREMLRPLLKDWLDAHLPSLVKWLVAEQIEKMIKEQKKAS